MQKTALFLSLLVLVLLVPSCADDTPKPEAGTEQTGPVLVLPDEPYNYADLNLPPHVGNNTQLNVYAANNIPSDNPTTNEGSALGRVLFYDLRLSEDNSISCASCHLQENAFANESAFSIGIDGNVTPRSTMSLFNMRYFRDFFWDMAADGLEAQVLVPIQNSLEMNSNLDQLLVELSEAEEYEDLFEAAFGDPEVTTERISRSLSQFIRSMVSFNARYDLGLYNDFAEFSQLELDGKDLFFSGDVRCNQCHASQMFFTRLEPSMNGLPLEEWDTGFFQKTGNPDDIGKFKIVSLRNVEVNAPYMHDGRFETLEEVIEHYNSGIVSHPNLDDRFTEEQETGGTPLDFNLSDYQKESLVAFLKTLTDESALTDERFSDPFVY